MENLGSKDLEKEERKLEGGGHGEKMEGVGKSSLGRDLQVD